MLKTVVEISAEPIYLSVKNDQLLLRRPSQDNRPTRSIPCEDIGAVVIEHPQATISQHAMARLAEFGAVIVICDGRHLPAALCLPLSSNVEVVSRLKTQIKASIPTQKRLWRQLVIAKIKAQARNLHHSPDIRQRLRRYAASVKSGDPANMEAHAARAYWRVWLTDISDQAVAAVGQFRRNPDGDGINALLNYSYAIIRAGMARALVSAGLQPALGIHHHNRSNAFALADDLMEPLRPIADRVVHSQIERGSVEICPEVKPTLLALLYRTVSLGGQSGPLMVMLHRYTAGFVRCLKKEEKRLAVPIDAGADST